MARKANKKKISEKNDPRLMGILESLRRGAGICDACKAAKLHVSSFYRWMKSDPKVEQEYEAILESRVVQVEDAFFQRLILGRATEAGYIFYLTNRKAGKWKNRYIQRHEGEVSVTGFLSDAIRKGLQLVNGKVILSTNGNGLNGANGHGTG